MRVSCQPIWENTVNLSVTLHLPACHMLANEDLAPRRLIFYLPFTHTHAHTHAQTPTAYKLGGSQAGFCRTVQDWLISVTQISLRVQDLAGCLMQDVRKCPHTHKEVKPSWRSLCVWECVHLPTVVSPESSVLAEFASVNNSIELGMFGCCCCVTLWA